MAWLWDCRIPTGRTILPRRRPVSLNLIERMLEEREGAELPVWQLYDKLSTMPYGLPYVVIQLYLLAFVRRGAPRVDLLLKARHSLRKPGPQAD